MTDVRRVTLFAAVLWISLHLTEAVLYHDLHRSPPVLGLGLLLAVLVAVVSLRPLTSDGPALLTQRDGALLVLGATAMTLCVHPFLTPDGLTSYANWPMGEVGVLVATLVLRECLWCAVATTAAVTASNAAAVWVAHQTDPGIGLLDAVFLSVPPATWLAGSLGIRAVFRRGALLREEYVRRGFTFADEERVREAVRTADRARRQDLRARVEPLLRRVEAEGATPAIQVEARLAAEDLRDTLKARSLLTDALRDQIASARARGVRVTVSSTAPGSWDGSDRPLVAHARRILEGLLADLLPGSAVSCRLTTGPPMVLLLVRPPSPYDVAHVRDGLQSAVRALRRSDEVDALLEEYDGELVLELRDPVDV